MAGRIGTETQKTGARSGVNPLQQPAERDHVDIEEEDDEDEDADEGYDHLGWSAEEKQAGWHTMWQSF